MTIKSQAKQSHPWEKLPDHSVHVGGNSETLFFSDEQINELQCKYGFAEDFPIDKHLEDCALHYQRDVVDRVESTMTEQRTLLKALSHYAAGLDCVLGRLGFDERERLYPHLVSLTREGELSFGGSRYLNESMRYKLQVLRTAADNSLRLMEGEKSPTRQKDMAIRELIMGLRRVYVEGTGHQDKYTRLPDTQEYSGYFLGFVSEVLTTIGAARSGQALAELFDELLSE